MRCENNLCEITVSIMKVIITHTISKINNAVFISRLK